MLEGQMPELRARLRNRGASVLTGLRVLADCGCFELEPVPDTLPVGATAEVLLRVGTKGKPGPMHRFLRVVANELPEVVTIPVSGNVRQVAVLDPPELAIAEGGTAVVTLRWDASATGSAYPHVQSLGPLRVQLRDSEAEGRVGWRRATVEVSHVGGESPVEVVFDLGRGAREYMVPLAVMVTRTGRALARPPALEFGMSFPDAERRAEVVLLLPKELASISARTKRGLVDVETHVLPESSQYAVVARLKPTTMGELGDEVVEARLAYDDATVEVLRIPVSGHVVAR
ncbi:MAG: DUF1573 domain-containing protein [Planctomycetes bacterium]|nr:DUF1573 domain-containing protein [Planctomycetota bacterium]MCB9828636.1 DUF1573 domain-containing protein [Planctomycetota bacterium]MCB9900997.1 DUF1573 domain-containing protein [Planctomycetota bacterium]